MPRRGGGSALRPRRLHASAGNGDGRNLPAPQRVTTPPRPAPPSRRRPAPPPPPPGGARCPACAAPAPGSGGRGAEPAAARGGAGGGCEGKTGRSVTWPRAAFSRPALVRCCCGPSQRPLRRLAGGPGRVAREGAGRLRQRLHEPGGAWESYGCRISVTSRVNPPRR